MSTKEPRFHGEVTEKSHKNMSMIRGKDTSIEVVLRKRRFMMGNALVVNLVADMEKTLNQIFEDE